MVCSGTGNVPPDRSHSPVPPQSGAALAAAAAMQSDGGRAETPAPGAGVLEEVSSTLASARGWLSNFLDLMSLEARRAGLAIVWMVVWGLVSAICIAAAWLGLMAALALWAVSLGFPPIVAVIAVAAINLITGAVLIKVCYGMSRALLFSATRRQVAGAPTVTPSAP